MLNTTTKTALILQLCLAFSTFLWILFDPFMGEHFRLQQDRLLIKNLKGDTALYPKASPQEIEKLQLNQTYWSDLPESEKEIFQNGIDKLSVLDRQSFMDRLSRGFYQFLVKTPFFLTAWIFFSIVISILCLKGKEGAYSAAIILPLLVLLYAADLKPSYQQSLFPSEVELETIYLKEPITGTLSQQKEQLLKGFHLFLIEKWGNEAPSNDPVLYKQQLAKGEFQFNKALALRRAHENYSLPPHNRHILFLFFALLWNGGVFVLLQVNKKSLNTIK